MTTAIVKRALDNARADAVQTIEAEIIEVERLYLEWVSDRSQSVPKLAEKTGLAQARVREILKTGEFQKRYIEDSSGFREVAKQYTRARAEEVMDSVIGRMTEIVEDGEARDAIGAARVLWSMVEDSGPKEVNQTYVDQRVLQLASEGIKSVDDLRRINAFAIDGNISRVAEERNAKGK